MLINLYIIYIHICVYIVLIFENFQNPTYFKAKVILLSAWDTVTFIIISKKRISIFFSNTGDSQGYFLPNNKLLYYFIVYRY